MKMSKQQETKMQRPFFTFWKEKWPANEYKSYLELPKTIKITFMKIIAIKYSVSN